MQSAPIKPAQLMMEFMAGEQAKINQGISSREFSQHLEEQNRKEGDLQHIQSREPLKMTNRLSIGLDRQRRAEAQPRRNQKAGAQADSEDDSRNPRTRARRALPSKNLPLCEWKAAQQLHFTDPMALDKVLNELQLSPSLKEAYKDSESQKGSISLQELSGILDRASSGKEILISDGKAAAADVQSVLASLQNGQRNTSVGLDPFQIKQAGFYSFSEFRQLLKGIAHQTAKEKMSRGATGSFNTPLEKSSDKANFAEAGALAPDGKMAGQTQSLATSFLPSFLKEPGSEAGKAEDSLGAVAAPKAAEKGDAPFDFGLFDQSNHAMNGTNVKTLPGHGSAHAQTPAAGSDHAALLQALKDLSRPATPQGAQGATPTQNQTAEAQPVTAELGNDSQGPHSATNGSASASATVATTGTSGASLQNTASSLVDSVKSHGEAVIRSYHFEPEPNRNVNGQNLASTVSGDKTASASIMEEVAASGEANAASSQDQQGQPNFLSFAKDGAQSLMGKSSAAPGTASGKSLLEGTSPWSEALSERIQELHRQKQNQLTLELESKDLGRIFLRVETEQNQVKAVISTESEQAQELLAKSSAQLRQQLESQGLVLSQLQIDLHHHRGGRKGYQNHAQRGTRGFSNGRSAARENDSAPGLHNLAGRYSENQIINVFA
jgi:flagellar hook-length control protein FliK